LAEATLQEISWHKHRRGGRHNNKNLYYIIGALGVAVVIGAIAYQSGYFGEDSPTTPNANPSTTNTTTP
jgi:hypothetical protein